MRDRGASSMGLVRASLVATLGVLLCAQVARADEPGRSAGGKDKPAKAAKTTKRSAGVSMEEITVTARRRPELLQETPVSISAFTATDIEQAGFTRMDDLNRYTPNVSYTQNGGTQENGRAQIRGIGTSDPVVTRDPGVGVYVDDVYLARSQGQLLPVLDVERIEVLRGPQGTLYGRNTMGGAVKVLTRAPTEDLEGVASARLGNYDLREIKGIVNIPLRSEVAAARMSFTTSMHDGYTFNKLTRKDADDRKSWAGRAELRLNPSQNVEMRFTGDQTSAHNHGRGGECRYRPDAVSATDPNGLIVPENLLFQFSNGCNASRALDKLDFLSPVHSKSNSDTQGLSSTIEWEASGFNAKSITAWRHQKTANNLDFTFGTVNIGNTIAQPDSESQLSQEFNLTANPIEKLTWTGGLFYFQEQVRPGRTNTLVGFNICQNFNLACNVSFQSNLGTEVKAAAAYTQATYEITSQLNVTAGLRRSIERKESTQFTFNFLNSAMAPSPSAILNLDRSSRFGAWTPLLTVSYDVSQQLMLFATYSRGFKSGGFNGRPAANVAATLEPFKQESLDNFEVGMKSELLDNRVSANLTLFHGKYEDIQQTALTSDPNTGGLAASVQNAAEAIIQGLELEMRAYVVRDLDLSLGIGVTDARFSKLDPATPIINPISGNPIDDSSLRINNLPPITGTATAAYTIRDVLGIGDLTPRVSWYYRDRITYGPTSHTLDNGKIGLLSTRITFALKDNKTEIVLWGENVLDRRYLNDGLNFEDGFASSLAFYGAPRTFGIEARYKF